MCIFHKKTLDKTTAQYKYSQYIATCQLKSLIGNQWTTQKIKSSVNQYEMQQVAKVT